MASGDQTPGFSQLWVLLRQAEKADTRALGAGCIVGAEVGDVVGNFGAVRVHTEGF